MTSFLSAWEIWSLVIARSVILYNEQRGSHSPLEMFQRLLSLGLILEDKTSLEMEIN